MRDAIGASGRATRLHLSVSLNDRLMDKENAMALATLVLGAALFALFFGLVAACDRL